MSSEPTGEAAQVLSRLGRGGATLATAESLTGGLLGAALTAVPGASAVYRGGVVAYASDLKTLLLGVDPDLLAAHGAVHPDVAQQMAAGVRTRLAATYGVATTGVAGPTPQDGAAVGTVHVAVVGPPGLLVRSLGLSGTRDDVRAGAVTAAIRLLGVAAGAAEEATR